MANQQLSTGWRLPGSPPVASRPPLKKTRLLVSSIACVSLLTTSCAPGGALSTREQRIGFDTGTDSCRAQLVALDSTGNFFGESIIKGAATGALAGALIGGLAGGDWRGALIGAGAGLATGAAVGYWQALQQQRRDQAGMLAQVQSDLSRENVQIDRTQIAFDQLMDCRFRQAQAINADYRSHIIDRSQAEAHMAAVRQLAQHDVALAKQINAKIQQRGQQFEVAAENLTPESRAEIARLKTPQTQSTMVRQTTALRLQPSSAAPSVTQISAQQRVTISGTRGGYAVAETDSGQKGYIPLEDLQSAPSAGSKSQVQTLAGSNAARRDDFAQSVSVADQAVASGSGFQLAG